MSIQDIKKKFKAFLSDDTLFYGTLMVLMAVASFGLGRHSVVPGTAVAQPASIILSETTPPERGVGMAARSSGQFVGSKNSDKYHHTSCPGASRIKDENKVWFASQAEAEAAGYSLAANCEV